MPSRRRVKTQEVLLSYDGAGNMRQKQVRTAEGVELFIYGVDGALVSTERRRPPACKESDTQGNCMSETLTKSVGKGGKVEEITELTLRTYTDY